MIHVHIPKKTYKSEEKRRKQGCHEHKKRKKRFPLLSEKGVAVNKKRKMKSPTGRFNSGNPQNCQN